MFELDIMIGQFPKEKTSIDDERKKPSWRGQDSKMVCLCSLSNVNANLTLWKDNSKVAMLWPMLHNILNLRLFGYYFKIRKFGDLIK